MTAPERRLVLYTGTLCPLCQKARDTVYSVLPAGTDLKEIVIDGDDALRERYATAIPVVAVVDAGGGVIVEKGWPFTPGQVKRLLEFL